MSYGWLSKRDDITRDETHFGIPLRQDPPLQTRWEEFQFVKEVLAELPTGLLIDAACGFEPGVHIMPEIAASLGWEVIALDKVKPLPIGAFKKPFPKNEKILRVQDDILDLSYPDNHFDAYICISALEHLTGDMRLRILIEAWRVLRPKGTLIVTMDEKNPRDHVDIIGHVLFDFGEEQEFIGEATSPAVAFLVGTKR